MARHQVSTLDDFYMAVRRRAQMLATWARGPGRQRATVLASGALHQMRRNLAPRRLLSFPHALVLVWMVVLLWGERWVFDSKVQDCAWRNWEKWVRPRCVSACVVVVADSGIISPKMRSLTTWYSSPTRRSSTRTRTPAARGR